MSNRKVDGIRRLYADLAKRKHYADSRAARYALRVRALFTTTIPSSES